MGITIIIVGGLVALTFIAMVGDVLGKKARSGSRLQDGKVEELERRLAALEAQSTEKDKRIELLERNQDFMNRLIEDKSPKH